MSAKTVWAGEVEGIICEFCQETDKPVDTRRYQGKENTRLPIIVQPEPGGILT